MKHCPKCRRDLDESEFYRDRGRNDGLFGYCKECSKAAAKEWYARNRDYKLTYCQERDRIDPRPSRCRVKVMRALERGRLKRSPCEACGDPNTEGHHDDYDKPLEVRWLCRSCHRDLHEKMKKEVS